MRKIAKRILKVHTCVLAFFSLISTAAYAQGPISIPQINDNRQVPEFIGKEAVANPISALPIPHNPFMGPDPLSVIHDDSYMSDTYPADLPGPLGKSPTVLSTWLGNPQNPMGLVVVMTMDASLNRLIAAAIKQEPSGESVVQLTLINATTLETRATLDLPKEIVSGSKRPSGAYFFTDKDNRTIIGTADRTIWIVYHTAETLTHDPNDTWDLTGAIPEGDSIQGLQPDWSGRLWFTSKGGVVGTLDMGTGKVIGAIYDLQQNGERIVNGHAAGDDGGVYIVSTLAMYRFDADNNGKPVITWRETYDQGTHEKAGQVDIGSGTTPTLMGEDYVAITDNGQPRMHVLVYRRAKNVEGPRLACAEPVFQPGHTSNENSLVCTEKSIIVENNFGYKSSQKSTVNGHTTKPGLARVDMDEGGGCHTVWTNDTISIPSLVTKMSLNNGLIYTYTKPKGPPTTDPWYFTAVDFRTGDVVWKQLAGFGVLYDNDYAAIYLGPNGMLYVGVNGGIVAMHDTNGD